MVVAGLNLAQEIFHQLSGDVRFEACARDGSEVAAGGTLARVEGPAAVIARLRLAAATAEAGDAQAAAALYREVAGEAGLDPAYADLARRDVDAALMPALRPPGRVW